MNGSSEADIHFELYRHLQNAIDAEEDFGEVSFSEARPEYRVNGGLADIVVFDHRTDPFLVIEAKRPDGPGSSRDLDPYSPHVIRQAFRYAAELGAAYFATYNGSQLVLFHTFEEGTHLLDRRSRSYEVTDVRAFAPEFLREVGQVVAGEIAWDPHHEAFVTRLKTYHSRLAREFSLNLEDRLDEEEFSTDFQEWVEEQGWKKDYENRPEDVRNRFLSQAAYLLMNKLLFYKILEDSPAYEVPDIELEELADSEMRREVFEGVIESVDFEAVYEHDPIFDRLSLTSIAGEETEELLEELEAYDLSSQFDHDVIGQIYQGVIPPEERHDLGQYYTPPEVVRLINRICITSGEDRVMDPGCGSGSFLVDAYRRLRELDPELDHEGALDQIRGVDINRFPAHLSAINLALRDLGTATHEVNVEVADFFKVDALQGRLSTEHAGVRGEDAEIHSFPTRFDAVVANPPYIRQEQIPHKDECRDHLDRVGADLDRRSDIYGYFFTHAREFLGETGRLGFLTSDRWLSVRYGEALQDFFLDNFRIRAVVNFSRQIFDIALIGTCVTILERCDDEEQRDGHTVKFLQVREPLAADEIISLLEEDKEAGVLEDFPSHRIATLEQRSLHGQKKWNRFFNAPQVYWEIWNEAPLTRLDDLVSIKYGVKTGANDCFYFRSKEDWRDAGIDSQFVRPLLKHVAQTERCHLREEDSSWYVLDVQPFIDKLPPQVAGDEEAIKDALREAGHEDLVDYLERYEAEDIPDRASIENRPVWFSLGDLPTPPILLSEVYWRECRSLVNTPGMAIDKRLYGVWPGEGVDPDALAGYLNSSLYAMMRELHGRTEQGEGMNRNTIMVYEARDLPAPDLRAISADQSDRIADAFQHLLGVERTVGEDEDSGGDSSIEAALRELDRAILEAIGMGDELDRVRQAVERLIEIREAGAGQHTTRMVDSVPDEGRRVELRGARRVSGGGGRQLGFDGI